ncbi:hypothetical protein EGT07_05205 [Herbaspirillum sp. HC18]|nr:hypothetical protein EGT07_05205 [Herbaspirillum sp. HC18]
MAIDFTPQFHKRLSKHNGRNIWVAIPHPRTLIPVKTAYYRAWQQEERLRLTNAGEEVLAFAVSH